MEGGDLRMSSIDTRVVAMKFDNAQFQTGVASTLKSLDALNKGLKLEGATKGLTDLSAASKNVSLSHIETGIQSVADKFKAMSVVGITALVGITQQAIATGAQLVKSLTIAPITAGFHEYETNLNSIQTILANTGLEGKAGLAKVNAALQELNTYSDQTIYNFSEMARNIGTFTAAGVKLDVATSAIKGIANLAALSGSNAQQASTAMYQLSQAISAGKVSLEDWNSVVNAGMGGKVFQDALIRTARLHKVNIDQMIKDEGSFRLTLQKGWLTGQILTETLSTFTGDLTAAQLKTMGYNQQQITQILKMAAVAKAAATEVKTASQLIGTLQEAVGSGWTRTWELIFGDFDEAKTLWTGVNNILGEFIQNSADARNKVLGDWKELGGRTALIDTIGNAFKALIAVVKPIRDAFREIFPATTGKQLYDLTIALRDFTKRLEISSSTADKIKRTFAGFFAILGLGWDIVRKGIQFLFRLFGVVTEGSGGILDYTANLGDFVVVLAAAIKKGEGIEKFFEGLSKFIEPPIRLIKSFAAFLGSLFDGFNGEKAANGVKSLVKKLDPLANLGHNIYVIWSGVFDYLQKVFDKFYTIANKVNTYLKGFGSDIGKALQGINLQGIVTALGAAGFLNLLLSFKKLVGSATEIFDGVTGSLGAMQKTLKAATLLEIALAILTLSGAIVLLSKVDPGSLAKSLTAITVMFTQLMGAMLVFEKLSGFKGFAKMPFIAASMILLAVAVDVLAIAVKSLASLSWDELKRGLTGVTALLALVIATMYLMPPTSSMIASGTGIVILAAGIKILSDSVKDLAKLDWQTLSRGLTGVGAILAALTLFSRFAEADALGVLSGVGIILLATGLKILTSAVKDMAEMTWAEIGRGLTVLAGALTAIGLALTFIPPTAPLTAAGIVLVAASLKLISNAIQDMATMSWAEIGRGLTVLAGALTAIGLALTFIPPTAPLTAAGIAIVAASLGIMGDAIKDMSKMSWAEIGRGLTVLGGALLIIAIALNAMVFALPGAAALLIVAAALAIIVPILMLLSQMSWGEIGKGLAALAGVFVVLGLSAALLAGLVPILIGLGIAIVLLGTGVVLAGAGVFLFATALTALAISGAAATVALVAMVGALAGLIPEVMKQIGLGIVAFANAIAAAHPALVGALVAVIMALISAIETLAPKLIDTLYKLLVMLFETIVKYLPRYLEAGINIVVAILNGISKNINRIVDAATNLAVNFLDALGRNIPKLIQAGVTFVLSFINGVADAIRNNSAKVGEAGANLGTAIVEGMVRGIGAAGGKVADMARSVANKALNAAKSALGINSPSKEFEKIGKWSGDGLVVGLNNSSSDVQDSAAGLGDDAMSALSKSMSAMAEAADLNLDYEPTIRPVLDLTNIRKGTSALDGMFNGQPISVKASYTKASDLTNQTSNDNPDNQDPGNPDLPRSITFIQNNNSPKALSTADIYRQTKNQLSTTKEALP
jgi:hypothetical protein